MAYQIKLNIKGETCVFTRNGEPTLRDTTNALKVQQQQLRMLNRKDGPSNDDYDENEKNLAKFAVDFWKNQFTADDVIDGSSISLKSLDSINDAIGDSLSDGEEDKKDTAKKITEADVKEAISNLDDFYKARLSEGYRLADVDAMTLRDIEKLNQIYEERETTIDKAFPFLF
ncbi:tail assembly chaperone [Lactobacillus phage PL-1]|uniref:Tail assembly chaperone n=2 Tax=Junavirus TaxID=2843397 RepID=U5U3V2_9CAUD|nr:tail assembly chaperone [Lactobacillus phage J-1]YP_008767319.1 tail assembly chaperone [Lactobacillus phage PL-1]AGZ17348.1 tail assembly chaperone [Lactobacillus phage J-1]AGZ17411.1 tail assembly chaperone [Lactobacillus phage PL-1]